MQAVQVYEIWHCGQKKFHQTNSPFSTFSINNFLQKKIYPTIFYMTFSTIKLSTKEFTILLIAWISEFRTVVHFFYRIQFDTRDFGCFSTGCNTAPSPSLSFASHQPLTTPWLTLSRILCKVFEVLWPAKDIPCSELMWNQSLKLPSTLIYLVFLAEDNLGFDSDDWVMEA